MKPVEKNARPKFGQRLRWGPRGTAAATIAARLTFDNVQRRYKTIEALRGVTLDIEPGEIMCMLGPSGCGKTTLLRLTAGVERPSGGRILINEKVVASPEQFVPPEQRGVGLMFQDFALFPHLTLQDNVAFGLKALGRSEATRVAFAALERVGLARYANQFPHILSGGDQQRVALARAIAPRPGVLLMDEPFSGLDTRLREEMREETLTILKETRATCMVVTHSSEEAMRMGNRIALMQAGRLIQTGTAEELYHAPADLNAARMFSDLNEIECIVAGGRIDTPLGRYGANGFADGETAVLCVRQRDIQLVAPSKGHSGRVLNIRFLGESARVEVGVEGLEVPLLVRVHESEAMSPGTEVGVKVARKGVLLFAQGENGSPEKAAQSAS